MIHEVDEVLRALVRRDALGGSTEIDVVFDAPTKDWSTRRGTSPTIDVYLYDVREDLRRRESGRVDRKDDSGRVVERVMPPRWFKLSYLVTAWTQRPEDEHLLLTRLLGAFLRNDSLPRDLLPPGLAGLDLTIPLTIAVPPPEDRALSDTWSALGGELKPSLDVVVIAPFDLARPFEIGPPVLEGSVRLGTRVVTDHADWPTDGYVPLAVQRSREAAARAAAAAAGDGAGTLRRGRGRRGDGDGAGDGRGGVDVSERIAWDLIEGDERPRPGRRFWIYDRTGPDGTKDAP